MNGQRLMVEDLKALNKEMIGRKPDYGIANDHESNIIGYESSDYIDIKSVKEATGHHSCGKRCHYHYPTTEVLEDTDILLVGFRIDNLGSAGDNGQYGLLTPGFLSAEKNVMHVSSHIGRSNYINVVVTTYYIKKADLIVGIDS